MRAAPPEPEALITRLGTIAADAGWARPEHDAVSQGPRRERLGALASHSPHALRVAAAADGLVLAAQHQALDGLSMLAALSRLLGQPVRSAARGVDKAGRPSGGAAALLGRAWEVGARPQAVVAPGRVGRAQGDALASTTVDGEHRTADLVHAGARAVAAWNVRRGATARRISVAVGVSTVGGASQDLADNSAFLRLRDVEQLSLDAVRQELAHAPLQPGGGDVAHRPVVAAAGRLAQRLAAPRLGSTLLVSHLGRVDVPEDVSELAFYPVTGGGSGLSLGAATTRGRTTLTLRARASHHDDEGLQQFLALVAEMLV